MFKHRFAQQVIHTYCFFLTYYFLYFILWTCNHKFMFLVMKAYTMTYRHDAAVFVSNVCQHKTYYIYIYNIVYIYNIYIYIYSIHFLTLITLVRVSKCHIGVHQMAKLKMCLAKLNMCLVKLKMCLAMILVFAHWKTKLNNWPFIWKYCYLAYSSTGSIYSKSAYL